MALTVAFILQHVANQIGDGEMRRMTEERLVGIYNATLADIAGKIEALERDSTFDIFAGTSRYAYPADAVTITGVCYFPDPATEPNRFSWLNEVFSDEERAITENNANSPSTPSWYRARRQWFQIGPIPDTDITAGGLVSYIHVPAVVTAPATGNLELPDFLWQYVVDGMIPRIMRARNEHAAADRAYQTWAAQAPALQAVIEDRSRDRRSAIRPPQHRNPYAGMT